MRRLVIFALTFYVLFLVPINAFNDKDVVKNYDYCVNHYSQIVFKNNLFFAIGWDGRIKASCDGISWSLCETGITDDIRDIEWNGKYYVAVGYDSILISYDGFNWEYKGSTEFFFNDIFWDGKKFIATGGQMIGCDVSTGVVAWSKDGIYWSKLDVDFKDKENLEIFDYEFLLQDGVYYLLGKRSDIYTGTESDIIFVLKSKDGFAWKESNDKSINTYYTSGTKEVSGNGISIKFKELSHEILITTNQNKSKKIVLSDQYSLIDAAYGNNKFVLLDNSDRILTSEDADNWTETEKKNSGINNLIFTGSKFLAIGNDGRMLISCDSQTWSLIQLNRNYNMLSVTYKKGIYVAVGYVSTYDFESYGLILTSTDGVNWESKELKSVPALTKIIYQYGKFKIYSSDYSKINDILEYESENGLDWAPINQRNKAFIYKTVTNGKNYLALTGNETLEGGLLVSQDGVKWDRLYIRFYIPEGLNSIKYSDILWNGKEYIVVGFYQEEDGPSGGIILSSKDGYNWRCLDGLTNNSIDCVAYGFGKIIAFSSEGLLLTITNKDKDTSTIIEDNYIKTFAEPYNYSKSTGTKKAS